MDQFIQPIFDGLLSREDREKHINQRSKVIWLTGLSGAGKSTIAKKLERELFRLGYFAQVLDGDNLRFGINKDLGFSEEHRIENIRRVAEISKLYLNSGIISINAFISPTNDIRQMAKEIIGEQDFIEVFVNTPLKVCEERDVKGLYAKARKGIIKNFTGIDSPYEIPIEPELEIDTTDQPVELTVEKLMAYLKPKITF